MIRSAVSILTVGLLVTPAFAQHGPPPVVDAGALMADKLGQQADLDVQLTDSSGQSFRLADRLNSERPMLLNLGYSNCPGMCDAILNAVLDRLDDSGMTPGEDFDFVTISIDETETLERIDQRRQRFVEFLTKNSDDGQKPAWTDSWTFAIGDKAEVKRLATSVGWNYYRDQNDYDHPPTVVLISPTGTTTRYLDYRSMTGRTLRRGIIESSDGKVGSFVERLFVTCLTFDPTVGKYEVTAMTVMRIGAVLTLVVLSLMIFNLWRRERQKRASAPTPAAT